MTTALAAAVSSGDMFTNLAVDQIYKEATTKPGVEHMQREDFESPTREFMQQCAFRDKWEAGDACGMKEASTTSRYQDIATQVDIQSKAKLDGRSSTMEV